MVNPHLNLRIFLLIEVDNQNKYVLFYIASLVHLPHNYDLMA
jgi:hypothetical protein